MYTATTCRLRNRDHVSVWTLTASQRTAAECTRTMLLLARTKLWNISLVSLAARSGLQTRRRVVRGPSLIMATCCGPRQIRANNTSPAERSSRSCERSGGAPQVRI